MFKNLFKPINIDNLEVKDSKLVIKHGWHNKEFEYDLIVLATGYVKPEAKIIEKYSNVCKNLSFIGDCNELARLRGAVVSGYNTGLEI